MLNLQTFHLKPRLALRFQRPFPTISLSLLRKPRLWQLTGQLHQTGTAVLATELNPFLENTPYYNKNFWVRSFDMAINLQEIYYHKLFIRKNNEPQLSCSIFQPCHCCHCSANNNKSINKDTTIKHPSSMFL